MAKAKQQPQQPAPARPKVRSRILNEPEAPPEIRSISTKDRRTAGFPIDGVTYRWNYSISTGRMLKLQRAMSRIHECIQKEEDPADADEKLVEEAFSTALIGLPSETADLVTDSEKLTVIVAWIRALNDTGGVESPLPKASSE